MSIRAFSPSRSVCCGSLPSIFLPFGTVEQPLDVFLSRKRQTGSVIIEVANRRQL